MGQGIKSPLLYWKNLGPIVQRSTVLRYAYAPRTFLKEKCIFVVVCISCLKKVMHLSNIFLLNIHFTVWEKKKTKEKQKTLRVVFSTTKTKKTREVDEKKTAFLHQYYHMPSPK